MNTADLQRHVNSLKDIRKAADWQGKFDAATRSLTKQFRYEMIAHPLDAIISELEAELSKRNRKRNKHTPREYRAPYSDN